MDESTFSLTPTSARVRVLNSHRLEHESSKAKFKPKFLVIEFLTEFFDWIEILLSHCAIKKNSNIKYLERD
jgi:hypothetical protein